MRENAGQPAAAASLVRCRAAGCPALLALRCVCIAACAALCVALVPLSVEFSPASLHVQRSDAIAAEPVNGALNLINEYASAAGLTSAQFIATVSGAVTSATGMYMGKEAGISFGNTASENLSSLIDAADYPDYSTLDNETQQLWGTKENYDAAKFNSLMGALGFQELNDEYYASGGGNFNPDDDAFERIQQFGRIGALWRDRIGVSFSDIQVLMSGNESGVYQYLGIQPEYTVRIPESEELWPEGLSRNFQIGYGKFYVKDGGYKWLLATNPNAYIIVNKTGTITMEYFAFEYGSFYYGTAYNANPVVNPSYGARQITNSNFENPFYFISGTRKGLYEISQDNVPILENVSLTNQEWQNVAALILKNGIKNQVEYTQDGYPSDGEIPSSTLIYAPQKMSEDTPWHDYVTQPSYTPPAPDERPQNPYNPSNPDNPSYQSGTPEWQQETKENLAPILNIRLHALFPFSLIYDLQLMWDRLNGVLMGGSELGEQAVEDYLHIRIPVNLQAASLGIDYDEEMVLDLTHLRDLLLTIKPFMAYLLSFSLLMGLISFWRRILTGA